jgi:hypothetical protein
MKKLLSSAFVLALGLLLAAELGVRFFLPHDVSGRFSYGYDPDAGFVELQDGTVQLVRAGGRRFRPQTFNRRRPADTCRIMVIGDSVPRGPSFQAAYAGQLQKILQARGIHAEVINLAVAGFGVRRSQLVLRKALEFDPSLIILHLNDSNEFEDEREYRRSQDFQGWHPKYWPMKVFIFARAYEIKTEKVLWKLVPEKIRLQSAVSDVDAKLAASLDKDQELLWENRVRQTTTETVDLSRRQGIPVILVTQGTLESKESKEKRLDDHGLDTLAHSLEGPGVYLLSMKEVFSTLTPMQAYFTDSSHLTPVGHELMARALADLIKSRLTAKMELRERARVGTR